MVGKRDYQTMIKHGGLWSFKRELLNILDLDEFHWAQDWFMASLRTGGTQEEQQMPT